MSNRPPLEIITCPQIVIGKGVHWNVFLGGGITGCPDWQQEFIALMGKMVKPHHRIRLVNPRRDNFDVTDPQMSEAQIEWEYKHLRICNVNLFWFPKETLCPITLFELGAALEHKGQLLVGCHPEYQRRFDVNYQMRMRRPELSLFNDLESMAEYLTRVK